MPIGYKRTWKSLEDGSDAVFEATVSAWEIAILLAIIVAMIEAGIIWEDIQKFLNPFGEVGKVVGGFDWGLLPGGTLIGQELHGP